MAAQTNAAGEACDRFFSTDELVVTLLHDASTLALLKCMRVCTLWKSIIDQTPLLQERLFFKTASEELHPRNFKAGLNPNTPESNDSSADDDSDDGSAEHGSTSDKKHDEVDAADEGRTSVDPPVLNPILAECFAPVMATQELSSTSWCSYKDIEKLPWAKDGTGLDAPTRLAYAREEASWRRMLVSNPPIYRLDWWHEWDTSDAVPEETRMLGYGHQDFNRLDGKEGPVTLGLLWDLIEGRLRRNCEAKILFFPAGQAAELDPTASEEEKEWALEWKDRRCGYTPCVPRIKLMTRQTWDHVPGHGERYDLGHNRWEDHGLENEDAPGWTPDYHGCGFNWLRHECGKLDFGLERWSMSESDYRRGEIGGDLSGSRHLH